MNRVDRDRLLADILGEDGLEAFRHASLEQGVAALRRRDVRRAALRRTVPLFLCMILGLGLLLVRSRHPTSVSSQHARSVEASTETKVINDEELFALFPGRSVALIGERGHQQLVFLDEPRSQLRQGN
jgi:hypothetical protein